MRGPFSLTLSILLLLMLSNVAKGWYAKVYFDDPEDAESGDGEGDEDMSTSEFTEDIASAVEPLESMASEIQNSTAVYNATSASSTMTEPVYATTSSVQPSSTINLTIIENHHPSPKSSATVSMPTQSPSGISSSIISPSLPSPPLHKESPQLDPNASMSPGIPLHNGYNKYGHPVPTPSIHPSQHRLPDYLPNNLQQEQRNVDISRPSITHNNKSNADLLINPLTHTSINIFGLTVLSIYLA